MAKKEPNRHAIEKTKTEELTEELKNTELNYTGKVYGICYKPHNGFANYAIVEMEIIDGIVTSQKIGEPYAAFEMRARLEAANNKLVEKMMQSYPTGFKNAV